MLFLFLLFAKNTQLEELEPAFVAECLSAELDHFRIYRVVEGDIHSELGIPLFKKGKSLQVFVYLCLDLKVTELE